MIFGLYYKTALLLFFVLQGVIFVVVLSLHALRGDRVAGWLGLLVFLACLYVCPWMFGHANWYAMDGYREFLLFVPFQQFFLIGPVIYFYTRSIIHETTFRRFDLIHFVPALLYFMYSLVVFITDYFILEEFYFYADGRDKDLDPWYQTVGILWIFLYSLASFRDLLEYRKRIVQEVSFADAVKLDWLSQFLVALLVIIGVRVIFFVLFPDWGQFGLKWWYYLIFAGIFYYIAFAGFVHVVKSQSIRWTYIPEASQHPSFEESSSRLSTSELENWKERIENWFSEKEPYLNPELTLQEVASNYRTNTRIISHVINAGFGKNFNDFVNAYRVERVKKALSGQNQSHLTLLGIAMDAGFNSKSTFNRVFKKFTGQTPKQYITDLEK